MTRSRPNIVITGTPGTGKSSHSELLASNTGLNHLCINEVVKKNGCHEGWDEELKSYIVNDDKVRHLSPPSPTPYLHLRH